MHNMNRYYCNIIMIFTDSATEFTEIGKKSLDFARWQCIIYSQAQMSLSTGGEYLKPNRLGGKRRECGLTQKMVADRLGMNYETYRMKETGRASFTNVEKRMLKELLKMTEEEYNTILYNGVLPIEGDCFFERILPAGNESFLNGMISENGDD